MNTTKINGTQYEISTGQAMINGSFYSVYEGITLIEGTNRIIDLSDQTIMRTIRITGPRGSASNNYLIINGIKYYHPTVLRVPEGTAINARSLNVRLNGKYKGAIYTYTIGQHDINVVFQTVYGIVNGIDIREE